MAPRAFVARGRFSESKGVWPAQACHRSFFQNWKNWKKLKVSRIADQKIKQIFSWFLRKYHFISGSTVKSNTSLLFCHFPRSGWPTWKLHHPFSDGKTTSVNTIFSISALVNNLLGNRASEGHSSTLLSQRKSHRNCFRFSLLLSAFPTVFFKIPCSIPSYYSLY